MRATDDEIFKVLVEEGMAESGMWARHVAEIVNRRFSVHAKGTGFQKAIHPATVPDHAELRCWYSAIEGYFVLHYPRHPALGMGDAGYRPRITRTSDGVEVLYLPDDVHELGHRPTQWAYDQLVARATEDKLRADNYESRIEAAADKLRTAVGGDWIRPPMLEVVLDAAVHYIAITKSGDSDAPTT